MLRLSQTRSYSVPIVLRALDILELLMESNMPRRMNDISDSTGIPRSTTYRILRTFVERGYVVQHLDGGFHIPHFEARRIIPITRDDTVVSLNNVLNQKAEVSGDQLVELLLVLLQAFRNREEHLAQRRIGAR